MKLQLLAARREANWELASPAPGRFIPTAGAGSLLSAGRAIGTLEVLGRPCTLVVPEGVTGYVASKLELRVVEYGEQIVTLVPGGSHESSAEPTAAASHASGLVFRAPTSGRFYGRSAPDKPAFVTAGEELASGATVCLLEVMKTFHRVHYSGDRARVREVLVREGDDVSAGDPLLALEKI